MTKTKKTIHFNSPNQIRGEWMLRLRSLEVYKSIFVITGENNKFKLYKFPDEKRGGISYEKVRDQIGKDLNNSDITATDLQVI